MRIMEITLNLPENIYRTFSAIAEKKRQRLEEVIADKLQDDFSADMANYEETVAGWSDEAVLALANLKLPKEQSDRMSVLLARLDEGLITDSEERELEIYAELSQISALRKAYGIAEAVRRGLINSPGDLK
jgi:hypothetical protein